jgi:hypothetical protein
MGHCKLYPPPTFVPTCRAGKQGRITLLIDGFIVTLPLPTSHRGGSSRQPRGLRRRTHGTCDEKPDLSWGCRIGMSKRPHDASNPPSLRRTRAGRRHAPRLAARKKQPSHTLPIRRNRRIPRMGPPQRCRCAWLDRLDSYLTAFLTVTGDRPRFVTTLARTRHFLLRSSRNGITT